jgi:hypothetical protein
MWLTNVYIGHIFNFMKLATALFLCLIYFNAYSTCIVIYKTQKSIYVVADNRRTLTVKIGKEYYTKAQSICKIHQVKNVYFAISGTDDGALLSCATKSLSQNDDLIKGVNSFISEMKSYYQKAIPTYSKESYEHCLKNNVGGLVFFGFKEGLPFAVITIFQCHLDLKNNLVVKCYVSQVADSVTNVLGISDHIDRPELINQIKPTPSHPELYMEQMVLIEAKYHPKDISKSVDIFKLTNNQAIWIKKNKNITNI